MSPLPSFQSLPCSPHFSPTQIYGFSFFMMVTFEKKIFSYGELQNAFEEFILKPFSVDLFFYWV